MWLQLTHPDGSKYSVEMMEGNDIVLCKADSGT